MEQANILVAVCGCGQYVKVSRTDEFSSGEWVLLKNTIKIIHTQKAVAEEVSGRVPMSHCDECVKKIISGDFSAMGIRRTKEGTQVIYTHAKSVDS